MSVAGLRIVHYVSLEGAGGVELQFADFVTRAAAQYHVQSSVVGCGRSVHPLVASRLPASTKVMREKYAGDFKLPKWPNTLRAMRQRRLIARRRPDAVVIWNRLRDSVNTLRAAGAGRCIYWERGAAWFADETPAKRDFLAGVQAVLCNSRAARRMLELRWDYRGQVCVVPNALRPAVAASGSARDAPAPGMPWRLGAVARLESVKGVALTIHALAELRTAGHDARLAIAGDGPERAALEALVASLGLAEAVMFHGLVADMDDFYRGIDLLVHPALREPFGQIGLEAAAHGVPAVVSAVDGLVEVVEDGVTGRCLPATETVAVYERLGGGSRGLPPYVYDPVADTLVAPRAVAPDVLATAVVGVLRDPACYAAFSRAGRQRVTREFDFDQHLGRALTAIQGFVDRGRLSWQAPV